MLDHLKLVVDYIERRYPYFAGSIVRQREEFGESWSVRFDDELRETFGNNEARLRTAVDGYCRFALDAMKLQVRFQSTLRYEPKSYAQASQEVYQNAEYMFGMYLPGILLSHFLWRHHYRQHLFFCQEFAPRVRTVDDPRFYDVGVGTGFYSKEMLRAHDDLRGTGFDLSPNSLTYAAQTVAAFGFSDRYSTQLRDIVADPVAPPAMLLTCVEVLEHLEDPITFLAALHRMLTPGGHAFITAAINAPNADHIYLYKTADEVREQLEAVGFRITASTVDEAYSPRKAGEVVPVNAAFIASK